MWRPTTPQNSPKLTAQTYTTHIRSCDDRQHHRTLQNSRHKPTPHIRSCDDPQHHRTLQNSQHKPTPHIRSCDDRRHHKTLQNSQHKPTPHIRSHTVNITHWTNQCLHTLLYLLNRAGNLHRVREKTPPPPKENTVKCTVYNTIQWHLHSI